MAAAAEGAVHACATHAVAAVALDTAPPVAVHDADVVAIERVASDGRRARRRGEARGRPRWRRGTGRWRRGRRRGRRRRWQGRGRWRRGRRRQRRRMLWRWRWRWERRRRRWTGRNGRAGWWRRLGRVRRRRVVAHGAEAAAALAAVARRAVPSATSARATWAGHVAHWICATRCVWPMRRVCARSDAYARRSFVCAEVGSVANAARRHQARQDSAFGGRARPSRMFHSKT